MRVIFYDNSCVSPKCHSTSQWNKLQCKKTGIMNEQMQCKQKVMHLQWYECMVIHSLHYLQTKYMALSHIANVKQAFNVLNSLYLYYIIIVQRKNSDTKGTFLYMAIMKQVIPGQLWIMHGCGGFGGPISSCLQGTLPIMIGEWRTDSL